MSGPKSSPNGCLIVLGLVAASVVVMGICCGGCFLVGYRGLEQERADLARADSLYDQGKRAEAVDIYTGARSLRSVQTERVIKYQLDSGNAPEAAKWAEKYVAEYEGAKKPQAPDVQAAVTAVIERKAKAEAKRVEEAKQAAERLAAEQEAKRKESAAKRDEEAKLAAAEPKPKASTKPATKPTVVSTPAIKPAAERRIELSAIDREYVRIKTTTGKVPVWENADGMSVGKLGHIEGMEVRQVIDSSTALCDGFLYCGINTNGMADGKVYLFNETVVVTGTTSYATVLGAKRTVYVVEPYKPSDEAREELRRRAIEEKERERVAEEEARLARLRTWTSTSGTFSVEAEYIDFKGGNVTLRKRDLSDIDVPLAKLSAKDQEYVRELRSQEAKEKRWEEHLKKLKEKPQGNGKPR